MTVSVSAGLKTSYEAAIAAAAVGGKRLAGVTDVSSVIGSGYKIQFRENGIQKVLMTATGSLPIIGNLIRITQSNIATVDANAALDLGSNPTCRIYKAADSAVYIECTLGLTGGSAEAQIPEAFDGVKTPGIAQIEIFLPESLDSGAPGGGDAGAGTPPGTVIEWVKQFSDPHVLVPPEFMAMHIHDSPIWNGDGPSPPRESYTFPNSFKFGMCGRLAHPGQPWYSIETTRGVYNFGQMGQQVNATHAAGKKYLWTIYGTPSIYAPPGSGTGPYGRVGENRRPYEDGRVYELIRQGLLTFNSGGVRRIHYIELWNEPEFDNEPGSFWDGYTAGTGSDASHLAFMAWEARQAINDIDPGVKLIGPGFVFTSGQASVRPDWSHWINFYTASDGHGGICRDLFDGVAIHSYNNSTDYLKSLHHHNLCKSVKANVEASGMVWANILKMNTEFGIADDGDNTTAENVALGNSRLMLISAASGYTSCVLYSYDLSAHQGGHILRTNSTLQTYWNNLYDFLTGKTIIQCARLSSGQVWARNHLGEEITV
jgi:hypothetical protein